MLQNSLQYGISYVVTNGSRHCNFIEAIEKEEEENKPLDNPHKFGLMIFIFLVTAGIVVNLLFAAVLHKGKYFFMQISFYTIVWQLQFCNIIALFVQAYIVIPLTYACRNFYGQNSIGYRVPVTANAIAGTAALYFTFAMTLHRYTIFLFPKIHETLFRRPNVWWTVAILWLATIIIIGGAHLTVCKADFDADTIRMTISCWPGWCQSIIDAIFFKVLYLQGLILPAIMFFMYLHIFWFVRSHRQKSSNISDLSLIAQGALVCLCLELATFINVLAPMFQLYTLESTDWLNVFMNCVQLSATIVNPLIFFGFSKDVRHQTKLLFQPVTHFRSHAMSKVRISTPTIF